MLLCGKLLKVSKETFSGPCPTVFDLRMKRLFQFDNLFYCFTVPDIRLQSCNVIHFRVVILMSCVSGPAVTVLRSFCIRRYTFRHALMLSADD